MQGGSLTIIVHGWGAADGWWVYPEPFPRWIHSVTGDFYTGNDPFTWSTNGLSILANWNPKKLVPVINKAADQLIEWVNQRSPEKLKVIAHSHGGNVALSATQKGLKVDTLILLGTPIREEFRPNLENVHRLFNIIHRKDIVQLFGGFRRWRDGGRVLPEALNIDLTKHRLNPATTAHAYIRDVEFWHRTNLRFLLI